jgi:hypothetical protein
MAAMFGRALGAETAQRERLHCRDDEAWGFVSPAAKRKNEFRYFRYRSRPHCNAYLPFHAVAVLEGETQ